MIAWISELFMKEFMFVAHSFSKVSAEVMLPIISGQTDIY